MPNVRQPRSGSMQFWPRKRAKRPYARIRTQPESSEPGLLGFAGYKAGMTHVMAIEANKHSHLKGEEISVPVTLVECPPMRIASVRFYKKNNIGMEVKEEVVLEVKDKNLAKKVSLPKKTGDLDKINPEDFDEIRVLVYTQPQKTGIGKKKPELFELGLGGDVKAQYDFVKEYAGKEIPVRDVFAEGEMTDIKAITKGKGFQGPVKRFGISIRQAKSEKSIRNPGSLGPWISQGHIMYRVPHAGKMGYHQRTEYNKQIMMVADPQDLEFKGGLNKYGVFKNPVLLIKGSVAGARKRPVIFQKPLRAKKKTLPTIQSISLEEKQGN